jgi:4-aminobutyrate aminotransferase-like enzyme
VPSVSHQCEVCDANTGHTVFTSTTMGRVLTFAPPLTVSDGELSFALDTLSAAFADATA